MTFQEKKDHCNDFDSKNYLPFIIEGEICGYVKNCNIPHLKSFSQYLLITDTDIQFQPDFHDYQTRSKALVEICQNLHQQGILKTLSAEKYEVKTKWKAEPFCEIPRSAAVFFGTRAFGIHVNGYFYNDKGELLMWIATRAGGKVNFPNQLDQIVAGGQPKGLSLEDNLAKEAMEEASIPKDLIQKAKRVSKIRYKKEEESGLRNDTVFVYDLELPKDFTPVNTDGEVASFALMSFPEALEITKNTNKFKFNCDLVIIDFAKRHGLL